MWKLIVLCAIAAFTAAEKATFENYKVFRLTPKTKAQVDMLRQLEEKSDGYSFWAEPSYADKNADLMIAPHKLPEFQDVMTQFGIPYDTFIDNVQELIDNQTPPVEPAGQSTSFGFTRYHTLEEIHDQLNKLAQQYPSTVQSIIGGRSYEGRQIKGVKVSFRPNNPGVFLEGGIHAREWIAPATVMYILHQLLTSKNPDVREMADRHDWYIFPSVNPDGYVYTHTTNRIWRKTRKPYSSWLGTCYGSDPNRNWGYMWMKAGASSDPCSETFAGSAPFSEIETQTLSNYIRSVSDKFYAYIGFHSFTQKLLLPYGHTKARLDNYNDLYAIGRKAITALYNRHGTQFEIGNIAEIIYPASGGSMDWVKGTLRIPIAYTYELRDRGRYGFLLPPDQIIPTGEEVMDSLVAMFKEARALGYPRQF